MKKIPLSILILFLCICSYCQKIVPIQPDRPDQTESPLTVPVRHFQAEIGLLFERANQLSKRYLLPGTLLKLGITPTMDLRLITEFEKTQFIGYKTNGLTPVKIGFKKRFVEEHGALPAIAFLAHIALPGLAAKELKAKYYAPSFLFAMQHTISEKISIGYNLGAEWDGENTQPVFIYTLTSGFSLTEKLGCYTEVFGSASRIEQMEHNINGGFSYLVRNNIMVDISAGAGLTQNAPDYFIGLGFSIRLRD
ncbi:MAG: transporter [Chitinophagaceae bacterium]|nr:transporter [Chitinophagaceae bacterium]